MESKNLLKIIQEKLVGGSQVLTAGPAKLYTNDGSNHKWLFSNLEGVFCIVSDPTLYTLLLRLYDQYSDEVLFETEMYYDFSDHLLELNTCFYCFPIEAGQVGVDFVKAGEAKDFANKAKEVCPKSSEDFKLPTDTWSRDDFALPIEEEKSKHVKFDFEVFSAQIIERGAELNKYTLSESSSEWSD